MTIRTALAALLATAALPALADPAVFAAASTARALDAAIAASGIPAVASYGASGTIARQIEAGAPADVFISANPRWMDYLVGKGRIAQGDVVTLMSNRLVLIAPEGTAPLSGPGELAAALGGEYFAMADPQVAPVGKYGQAALEHLGAWLQVETALVPTRNTLATVAAVARGEAALGLVYASDAAGVEGVAAVWDIPADSHPPILYLAAPVPGGEDSGGGARLIEFLSSPEGQAILSEQGFVPVPAATEAPS
ncbi:molybdate ABC transporter substrate-binding protein [Mangrovicoccus sp. HB161399]|uniref:molybdate ABC transporter substrate-binding protein n=1 Tax=Mangrovicoccus sp. HB161399 TaxID=2720392 RepID=UPI0015555799|nr:molybdate ABC transporter substrate-binding protein [Mangrovicoccus sp. HB161399]